MVQKTAVQWLKAVLEWNYGHSQMLEITWENLDDLLEQAKQIEREQIIDAHYQGYRNDIGTTEISEQYYNETFISIPQDENPFATGTEQ